MAYEQAIAALEVGDLLRAELAYREAVALDPDSPTLHYNLGLLLHQLGLHEQAAGALTQAVALCPDLHAAHASLFSAIEMAGSMPRKRLYDLHLGWAIRHADPLSGKFPGFQMGERPRRIGYVSADFRRHVVGRLIEPVIRCHDRGLFHVTCYSSGTVRDDMTVHLEDIADSWRNVDALDDEQFADVVRRDNIDILVDLSGHSAGNRLLTFARRVAPLQITWMGYLNTTGMVAMDYRVSDHFSDPQGVDLLYRERLLRLPHPQWCYVPCAGPVISPVVERSPASPDHPLRLACVTRFMKVTDQMVSVWVKILQALPAAQLTVIDIPRHPRADWLFGVFHEQGMGSRVKLLPTLDGDAYWKLLANTDLALDTYPYTGATTTLDCLWAEVPVISRRGQCGAARSASSILHAIGLQELSVDSDQDYVEKVVELAVNRERLISLSRGLRQRMLESPMCNAERFTGSYEMALEMAWDATRSAACSNV